MTIDWVIDASVAVKWLLPEQDKEIAWRFLDPELCRNCAPSLIANEVANALWQRVRLQGLPIQEARELLYKFWQLAELELIETTLMTATAFEIAAQIQHKSIYDCVYVALAVHKEIRLITADKELHKKLKGTKYESHIALLNDYATH